MPATIRKRLSKKLDRNGNPIIRYQVRWLEPVRDEFGAPTGEFRQTGETFDTERQAKARARRVDDELESGKGADPSSTKAKANRPLGEYAKQYFDALVGTIDDNTIQDYRKIYHTHIGPVFGSRPVGSITTADIASFRAELLRPHQRRSFVTRGNPDPNRKPTPGSGLVTRSPKTVKHIIGTLKRILDTAQDDQAISANPVIANRRRTTKRMSTKGKKPFKHHPLTANQVASVFDWIATPHQIVVGSSGKTRTYTRQGNDIYALAVLFTAHIGPRASELQGLQVHDVMLSDIPGTVGSVRITRTKKRKDRQWNEGTPKSDAATDRIVPLAPWLADEMREYLTTVHPFAGKLRDADGVEHDIPHAPLFPGRKDRYSFDWARPVNADNLYDNYLQPACKALGLGNVRFHDLRHSFATMNLSAGEHYMQVSKWLGHSSFVLTLTTYADYINETEVTAPKVGRGVANITCDLLSLKHRGATA
ncbi:tyrosine-type recombinase/integrase [Mycobacteroides abscessus]|uniref:tyrosine-type recombinase/integrase n=1 Tax=Mycobacteroides abscessus TaxID=36809 RepID=UPI00026832BF|nr:site-specific integrase [Mycobacteroides abscessus]EIT93614.1 phage integrase family protein [Mycobacteroides abscessus 4S-0726-RA]EIU00636.1 phage integrase family protein [Mycobacteroides abscessus 4S-0303]EIU01638.1 phage integrase family protein [Mycobacteroides abscessus 4S-0726-RB]EIV15321.1 phage integrase family protein [Mycobacteroides abscessus 4S-0206]EIV51867.1 phage integrase family protein [Mycobacteroides abscessus 4S-0116-R]